jgi:GR25 family glycosyltransferase involved in LPS biosynthesis
MAKISLDCETPGTVEVEFTGSVSLKVTADAGSSGAPPTVEPCLPCNASAKAAVAPSSRMRAICICLPEYPERIEKAKAHFESHGLDVEFFWGINAPVAGLATIHPYEVDHPGSGYRMGFKPTGCWLSHYMLWGAMTRMTDDAYLVLEDDAQLCDGFLEKFDQAMRDVPSDYAFLHPGHCCIQGRPMRHVAGDVYECKDMVCTHAYVIRRNIVPYVMKTLRKCWAPIDIQLQLEVFPNVKTYAVVPRIVSQFDTNIPP